MHFHVIPRYNGSRNFGALAFADAGWPGPPALEPAVALDTAAIDSLVARLRDAWQAAPGRLIRAVPDRARTTSGNRLCSPSIGSTATRCASSSVRWRWCW